MSDLKPLLPVDAIASTVSRTLPEDPVKPELPLPGMTVFSCSLSSLQPFPSVPTPPGLADRP